MPFLPCHWNAPVHEAKQLQLNLSSQVIRKADIGHVSTVGGVDVSIDDRNDATAAVSVLTYPDLELTEIAIVSGSITYPYLPGLLSFREGPIILEAIKKLSKLPDLLIFDGQGIAHPRRLGIASHIGLITNIPAIGCAKKRLCGVYKEPGVDRGSWSPLIDDDEIVGAILRTKKGVKPLYVSIGHRMDFKKSIQYILTCCKGYRLPEPIRHAHRVAGDTMRMLCHSASCA
jgi:deoxyribonuclease V